MEQTLSIIKPDGVKKNIIGDVIRRFEENGLSIKAMRMGQMTKREAQGFYSVHKERPFFDSLTDFICSGPVVIMVLQGDNAIALNRKIMGATNFKEAERGTIRYDHASSIESNTVHGSDAPETAAWEIAYFFSALDIMP